MANQYECLQETRPSKDECNGPRRVAQIVSQIFDPIADDSDTSHERCEPVQFARLFSELSWKFTRAQSNQLDAEIRNSLKQIAQYAHGDRAVIWQFEDTGPGLLRTYEWYHSGFLPYSNEMLMEGFRWGRGQLKSGAILAYENLLNLPPEATGDRRVFEETRHTSVTGFPMMVRGKVVGALCIYGHEPTVCYRMPHWRVFADIIGNALDGCYQELALKNSISEIEILRAKLEAESLSLNPEITLNHHFETLIGKAEPFKKVLRLVEQVADVDTTVLITGETGTGKELVARALHELSPRKRRPLVRVNCAALPSNLIESELFGHDAGAFTGASSAKPGRFEAADQGTLFLDEIGELPLDLQAKLLRVLQEGEFERLGSTVTRKVNVRVIAATNKPLLRAVEENRFRRDLYYRLHVVPIHCPPLRERTEDIPLLVNHFVNLFSQKACKEIKSISQRGMSALLTYSWPGNVRELRNVIERAVLLSMGHRLTLVDLFPGDGDSFSSPLALTLDEQEREYILNTLKLTKWRISGPQGAALILGLNPKTLESRMKKLGIVRPLSHF